MIDSDTTVNVLKIFTLYSIRFSSPEQRSRRAIVLPSVALVLVLASTDIKVFV